MTIDEVVAGATTLTPSRSAGQWHYTLQTRPSLRVGGALGNATDYWTFGITTFAGTSGDSPW